MTLRDDIRLLGRLLGGLKDLSASELGGVAVPLELDGPGGTVLTFLSTVTTFGTAVDLTAAEIDALRAEHEQRELPQQHAGAIALGLAVMING